jgi:hypothetical protein
VELWAELALAVPSQSRLDIIGCALRRSMGDADATFLRLLRLNPNSVPVMRRYAAFLREVCMKAEVAD